MQTNQQFLSRLYNYSKEFHSKLYLAISSSVLNKVLDLMPPVLVGWIVDCLSKNPPAWIQWTMGDAAPIEMAAFLAVLAFVIFGLESFFQWAYQLFFLQLAQDMQHRMRVDTYQQLQTREMKFFDDHRLGDTMAMLNDDVNQLERFLNSGLNTFVQLSVLFAFSSVVLFQTSWQLALVGLIPIPIIIWGSLLYQKKISPRYSEVRTAVGHLNARLENNISGIGVVQSFTAEDFELERVDKASAYYKESNYNAIKLKALYVPMIRMAIAVGFASVLFLGSYWVLEGKGVLTVGELVLFSMLIQRLLWPLTGLGTTLDEYERAKASAKRIFGLLDTESTIQSPDHSGEKNDGSRIEYKDVYFAYRTQDVINGIDLVIEPGQTVGFAGSTGAGKSTITKLLMRMYDVTAGSITLGGKDIRDMNLQDLRRQIALVSQDIYLFHGSIYENILYGNPGATEEEVYRAAAQAQLAGFVDDLPDKYHTLVGERGLKLSGGQRQRLSIARAILKDAPIMVFDEATSSVDTETEKQIQSNLLSITEGKTALVIAHRLSTIRQADRIYVLDEGRIVESGSHDELIALGGKFKELWDIQTGQIAMHS